MTAPPAAGLLSGGRDASHFWPLPKLSRRPRLFRSRASVSVRIEHRLPRALGTWLVLSLFATIAVVGVVAGDHARSFRATYGEPHHALARLLGFGIDKVGIAGIVELREAEVLAGAGVGPKVSLLFLDAAEARRRLEASPLISSASVRKLYPGELSITLTERKPAALWQRSGEVFVIAADGTIIDQMRDDRFARLPLVVGENANVRLKEYSALLEAAGPLRGRIRAGMLVSDRHWELKLDNGVDVRLPDPGAVAAIKRFVMVERLKRVSEKDVISIDMRIPDRLVLRLTEEAGAARAEAIKKRPKSRGAEI